MIGTNVVGFFPIYFKTLISNLETKHLTGLGIYKAQDFFFFFFNLLIIIASCLLLSEYKTSDFQNMPGK